VVAFSHSVHVEAAKLLVERFYRELGAGRTVGKALDEARVRLHAVPQRWLAAGPDAETIDLQDWFIPQLYQVGPDPALLAGVAPATGAAPALAPLDEGRLHSFPPPPRYTFQGRAQELLRLERDFRQAPAVLLTGMGGMGKTALAREAAAWWLRTGRLDEAVFVSLEQRLAGYARTEREPAHTMDFGTIAILATIGATLASIAATRAQTEASQAQAEATRAQAEASRAQAEATRMQALKTMLEIKQLLQQQGQAQAARIGAPGGPLRTFAEADEVFLRELLELAGE
jgi:hypothetical protein